jgi:hypothetical protein
LPTKAICCRSFTPAQPVSPAASLRDFCSGAYTCHRLKVVCAIEDELTAAPDARWADATCAAVNRYLHSPMKRHHGLRIAAQALDFVGKEG